jgi:hypothetical protein
MEFTRWWNRVIGRLRSNGLEVLPEAKPVDHEAFEAGMEADEWAWVYFHADEYDPAPTNGKHGPR